MYSAIKRCRNWTICELILPFIFGTTSCLTARTFLVKGRVSSDPRDLILDIGQVFFTVLIFGTFAFFCTCAFILDEMTNRMRQQMRIVSLNRQIYTMSYFLTQGIFALVTKCRAFSIIYGLLQLVFRKISTRKSLQQLLPVSLILFLFLIQDCCE